MSLELDELTPGPLGAICLAATIGISANPVSIPIVDNRFSVRIPEDLAISVSPVGASFRFEGAFASTTAASGLLTAEAPASAFGCAGIYARDSLGESETIFAHSVPFGTLR